MATAPVRRKQPTEPEKYTPNARKQSSGIDPYYSAVSNKFRLAKHISIIALIAFLIFSFTFLRSDISLENLRYLLKFISFTNTETSISASKINYASGDPNRLELFIGDLCTLTPSGYALYDSRGNQIMAESVNYKSPVLKVSSRFALCYDLDGTVFTILNTFTKLYDGTSEYPITDGTVADNGSFAIGSSTRDYHTAVTVYDSDFAPDIRILRNDRLMALEFKSDGSELALMTAGARNGKFYSTVEIIEPGAAAAKYTYEIDALGYSLYYTDEGFAVVTDEGICFFDSTLELTASIKHPAQLTMTETSGKYLTCLYSNGIIDNSYTAVIYDCRGGEIFKGSFEGKPIAIDSDDSGNYIFIHTGTTVSRVNTVNKKLGSIEVAAEAIDLLADSHDSFLVALENYALTYELTDFAEHYYDGTPVESTPETSGVAAD